MWFDLLQSLFSHRTINHVDCDTILTESPGTTDSMKISLVIHLIHLINRQVEVHDNIYRLHIDACKQETKF